MVAGWIVWLVRNGAAERVDVRVLKREAQWILVDADIRPGEAVVIEIRDLYSLPFELTGFVTWARTWDQSTKLPGIGIAFDGRGPIEHLVDALIGLPLLQSF